MSHPSEYSIKPAQRTPIHRNEGSPGTRFMSLLRSLFRPVSENHPNMSRRSRSSHPRPTSTSLKRRKTEPPVRSSSDYEYLSEVRNETTINHHGNVTLSETQFAGNVGRSSPPAIPPRTCNQNQYYTPQIKRANTDNFCAQYSGLHDFWIVNLDSKPPPLIRTTSQYRPGDRYPIRNESRPIYLESVEVSVSDALPHLQIQQPQILQQSSQQHHKPPLPLPPNLEKRVVSIANIPLDSQHVSSRLLIPSASEKQIARRTQDLDRFERKVELTIGEESRRQREIKERILAEWEQSWRHGQRSLDGSYSSLGAREEPSMVDDGLKEIPSPNLRPILSPLGGYESSRKSDWEIDKVDGEFKKDPDITYEDGEYREQIDPRILSQLSDKHFNVNVRRGHSFSNQSDVVRSRRLAKPHEGYSGVRTMSLASNLNHNYTQDVDDFYLPIQCAREQSFENKRLHSASTRSVPRETSETDYEFYSAKRSLPICPQSAPLQRKSVGPRVILHSTLQSKDLSDNTASNLSIDTLLEESPDQISPSEFINRCESGLQVTDPTPTLNMAKLRQRSMGRDVSDRSTTAPIFSPSSNLVVPNSLGDSLKNDSIDLGETGRVNYRTGSFLGRFGDHSADNTKKRKSEQWSISPRNRSGQTLNDYMLSGQLDGSVTTSTENSNKYRSLTRSIPTKPLVPKIPIEISKTTELDPVLALLLSDVSQLDELRNNFREKSVRNQKSLKISPSATPQKDQSDGTSRSSERKISPSEGMSSTPKIKQEDVDDAHRELTSKIHNLIDIECSSVAKKAGTMKKSSKDRPYKEQISNEVPKDDSVFLRVRQHQFRWSERHQRPYSAIRPEPPPPINGPEEVEESEIVPTVNGSTKPDESVERKSKPASRIISMLIPHMQDGIPIWVFSAGQLNVLRRMAQTQITLTHEQVCPSNRLIKWRIGRSKGMHPKAPTTVAPQATPDDIQQELPQSPISIVLNQQTESFAYDGKPSPLNATLNSSESDNSPAAVKSPDSINSESAFWPELKENAGSNTDLISVNTYGASRSFSGPVFGRTLAFWQRRVGYPFPPCICNMLAYLQQAEHATHGIFRRAGAKLRIQALRERIEKDIYV
ncbi:hypothetical protein Aperf_G00000076069 [Anoplocephala perfoliata]